MKLRILPKITSSLTQSFLWGSFLYATSWGGWLGSSGEESFNFLELNQSISSNALSGAGGAIQDSNFHWGQNPASALAKRTSFQFHYLSPDHSERLIAAALHLPVENYSLYAGFLRNDAGEIAERSSTGSLTGKNHYPLANSVEIGVASSLGPQFDWGASSRIIGESLADTPESEVAWGWNIDAGVIWKVRPGSFHWGLSVLRLGKRISGYLDHEKASQSGWTDAAFNLSLLYTPLRFKKWTLLSDFTTSFYASPSLKIGLIWKPLDFVHLKAGTQLGPNHLNPILEFAGFSPSEQDRYHWTLFSLGGDLNFENLQFGYSAKILGRGMGLFHGAHFRWNL